MSTSTYFCAGVSKGYPLSYILFLQLKKEYIQLKFRVISFVLTTDSKNGKVHFSMVQTHFRNALHFDL
jgi:hypothetical protein